MEIPFTKYHGAGNDFIIINGFESIGNLSSDIIHRMCNRHFGIGANGLIFINPSAGHSFEMKYFNADGNEGSMCGNGGRCAAQFVSDNSLAEKKMAFLAYDGVHRAEILADGVLLEMLDINDIHKGDNHYFTDSGSPHYITFVDNIDSYKVNDKGRIIRYSYREEGTNVNFVEEKADAFHIRTYERGVENETLACGTGVTAAAVAIAERSAKSLKEIHLKARGGNLTVFLEKSEKGYTNIWLKGPAEKVFEGVIKF